MDILYRLGETSAARVQALLPNPPGYTAVRTLLRILEEKGQVRHERAGRQFFYMPIQPVKAVRLAQLHHVTRTFFHSSTSEAIAILLAHPLKPFSEFEVR